MSFPMPLPPRPTTAAPGTPLKLVILASRADSGFDLFHPADAKFQGDLTPILFQAAASQLKAGNGLKTGVGLKPGKGLIGSNPKKSIFDT